VTMPLGRGSSSRRARTQIVILTGLLGLGAGIVLLGSDDRVPLRSPSQAAGSGVRPNPGASDGDAVHALGRLEPAAGVLTIGARPGVRIESIRVSEGDSVRAGDLLAILEGHSQAEKQLALAEAQKKSADHQRELQRKRLALEREGEDRLKGPRLDASTRMHDLTQQRLKQMRDLLPKLNPLVEKDERAKFDLAQTYFQVELAANKAELDLKELQAQLDLQPRRRALEDEGVAGESPDAEVLARQIDLARVALDQAEVHAPSPGLVLDLFAHPGEVSSGLVLSLGDVSAMVAKAEVYQSDVPRLAVGDPAEVSVQGRTIAGKVARIGRFVGRNGLKSLDPRALQDLHVVEVSIALARAAEASNYVNMQVDVTIRPGARARGPGGP
jgi:HlyD family secretion protein